MNQEEMIRLAKDQFGELKGSSLARIQRILASEEVRDLTNWISRGARVCSRSRSERDYKYGSPTESADRK